MNQPSWLKLLLCGRENAVTSFQATRFLPLVEPASIHVHTFKQNWLMWLSQYLCCTLASCAYYFLFILF